MNDKLMQTALKFGLIIGGIQIVYTLLLYVLGLEYLSSWGMSFLGLIFSMGLLEIVGPHVEVDYILNPSVNFKVALSTVFVLIIAGAIAGFFPAWRAVSIHTIDALRDE